MTELRIIIGTKEGKSYQITLNAEKFVKIRGKKIGDKIPGDLVDLAGYEFEIRGGTDKSGFPMRVDLPGSVKKRLLLSGGTGYHPKEAGIRKRKMIRGNTIDEDIAQINVIVVKEGSKKLDAIFAAPKGDEKAPAEKKEK